MPAAARPLWLASVLWLCAARGAGGASLPIVVNTWGGEFGVATDAAFEALVNGSSGGMAARLDALVAGGSACEAAQCDGSVGYGGHPDSEGRVSLDAMVMDASTMQVGAVAYLRASRDAIKVARSVLEHTHHSMLVGGGADDFAKLMGLETEGVDTPESEAAFEKWVAGGCDPSYYRDLPAGVDVCPAPSAGASEGREAFGIGAGNHDTVGIIVVDGGGEISCGVTTNGVDHKVAGRVSDSAVVGAGCYAAEGVGGAAGTGDGDVAMRFAPAHAAVAAMARGAAPTEACASAIAPILRYYPDFAGGLVCVNARGEYGAATSAAMSLTYSVRDMSMEGRRSFAADIVVKPEAAAGGREAGVKASGGEGDAEGTWRARGGEMK